MTSAKPRTRAIVYYRAKQWMKKESEMCREWRELRWNGKEEMRKRSPGRVEEVGGGKVRGGEKERGEDGGRRKGWRGKNGGGEEERIEEGGWRRRG